jgi:hypothetical protein
MSAALENTLATIAIAQSIAINLAEIYKDRPRNKTVLGYAARLNSACDAAFACWPGQIKARAIARIAARLERIEEAVGWGQNTDIAVYTSTALGLLEELRRHLPPRRRLAVDRVIAAVNRIHQHFDRRLDKTAAYERADRAAAVWRAGA